MSRDSDAYVLILIYFVGFVAVFTMVAYALSGCAAAVDDPQPSPTRVFGTTLAPDASDEPPPDSGVVDGSSEAWTGVSGGEGTSSGSQGGCCLWDRVSDPLHPRCVRRCDR